MEKNRSVGNGRAALRRRAVSSRGWRGLGPDGCPRRRPGFTLVELLVVIAILGILAALLLPTFAGAKRRAWDTGCTSNMKQIGTALRLWVDENGDWLPPGQGQRTGLNMGQSEWYDRSGTNGLVYYLATSLGEAAPDKTVRRARAFSCPANDHYYQVHTNSVARHKVFGLITEGNLGLPWNPFGYPASEATWNPGQPPHRLSEVNTIRASSDLWTLVDVDQAAPGYPGWRDTTPRTPAHGKKRNYLFFDSHVAGHPVMGDKSYSAPFIANR